ncbi:MAG: Homogentisate 1,2-dioxygenase, partial [uncultured Solirubrobacteraceae bacterium]
ALPPDGRGAGQAARAGAGSGDGQPARRGGDGLRGLLGQRVDPLPPLLPRPDHRRRRFHADRPRGVGARRPRASPDEHDGPRARGRRRPRAPRPAVQQRRRDLPLPARARGGVLLPRRRGRRGHLRARGRRRPRVRVRLAAVPQVGLRRDPARHDLPAALRHAAAVAVLLHAGRDRDAQALPQPLRPAARARAVLPARLPSAGGARDASRPRRVRPQGPRPRRLSGLRPRLPPVRRRRLGRLRLPVHVQHRRLRAQGGAAAPATARAPELPGPELRDLLVLPADARLGPRGDRAALPPLQSPVRGDDLLRRRAVRLAQGRRHRGDHAASVRPPARPAAGARREGDRRDADGGARRDVRHLPAAQAVDAVARPRRPELRVLVGRGPGGAAADDGHL